MVKREVPWRLALVAAHGSELLSSFTGKPPRAPIAGVRMARYKMWFNPDRAIRELGLPQTSPRQALADAVEWFTRNGYVRSKKPVAPPTG
jgi:dihydroflavonol-4-reductase